MTSSKRSSRSRHDLGAATPLTIAVLVVCSLLVAAITRHFDLQRRYSTVTTAAEAMALAAVLGADVDQLAESYQLDSFSFEREEHSIIVHISRQGATATASAVDHRHTLEQTE